MVLTLSSFIILFIIPLWVLYTYTSSITKLWHPNLRILEVIWSYYLAVILCGGIIYIFDAFYEENLHINNTAEVYARLVTVYGMYGIRCTFLAFIVERTLASIFSRIYENRQLSFIAIVLCFLTVINLEFCHHPFQPGLPQIWGTSRIFFWDAKVTSWILGKSPRIPTSESDVLKFSL